MKQIIESDICARCAHFEPFEHTPESRIWEIVGNCSEDWPYKNVNPTANAIIECPKFAAMSSPSREGA